MLWVFRQLHRLVLGLLRNRRRMDGIGDGIRVQRARLVDPVFVLVGFCLGD